MLNQNPEQIARDHIDKQLIACGCLRLSMMVAFCCVNWTKVQPYKMGRADGSDT